MKHLGDAELEIMQILWNFNEPITSTCVKEQLKNSREWSLPSVMTALTRLEKKGFVFCDRSTRTNYYRAIITEQEYKRYENRTFLQRLYDNSFQNLMLNLYDNHMITNNDLEELKVLIETLEAKEDD